MFSLNAVYHVNRVFTRMEVRLSVQAAQPVTDVLRLTKDQSGVSKGNILLLRVQTVQAVKRDTTVEMLIVSISGDIL